MGGLTNKVKSVNQPQYIYQSPSSQDSSPVPTPEQAAGETRRSNLLGRDRGYFGNVQTGFRGLLSLASTLGQRKTLLGE